VNVREAAKRHAAREALREVGAGWTIGVGTGSTSNRFIEALGSIRDRISGVVPSSEATRALLLAAGLPVVDLEEVGRVPLYVDGADEATRSRHLIKGGGGALTREKILAASAERFVCIIDESKLVERLGRFPLPLEVIPMAVAHVSRELALRGGRPVPRTGFTTDNGNRIVDVHDLTIAAPVEVESELNQIAGVVTVGLFCRRPADELIVGSAEGVRRI
jgi:ribose 5-phosphate isomerase A